MKNPESKRWYEKAPLEKIWTDIMGKYCRLVARNPWPFIIFPVLLTVGLAAGIFRNFEIVRGVHWLYSPLEAPWKAEEAVFEEEWVRDDTRFYPGKDVLRRKGLYLLVEAKEGGNVLKPHLAREFIQLMRWISNSTFTTRKGLNFTFDDICLRFQNDCFDNSHAMFLADVFAEGNQYLLNITFPLFYSQFATEPINLHNTLGGVTVDKKQRVVEAKAWMLLYQLQQHTEHKLQLSTEFEDLIESAIREKKIPTESLSVSYFHSRTLDKELAESNTRLIPKFSVTFSILIIFSVLCTFIANWKFVKGYNILIVDWTLSKPLMGVVGVVTTGMAIVSATGLLLLFDVTFVDMCTVMPFLSLTIGIDDTFLMLAAWHETSRTLPVEERIEKSMRHAAVSISITSLTDAIAFLIGSIAPLPAVKYFCYYSSAAIVFIFLFSISIFVAVLSLQGMLEEEGRHCMTLRHTENVGCAEKLSWPSLLLNSGTCVEKVNPYVYQRKLPMKTDERMWYQKFFEDSYAPLFKTKWLKALTFFLISVYAALTITGLQRLVTGFDLMNIVVPSSPARRFMEVRSSLFPDDITHMDLAVMKPPNMGNTVERTSFLKVLGEFENPKCTLGRDGTDFWYFAYENYMERLGFGTFWKGMNNVERVFNNNLDIFLLANEKYAYDVLKYKNNSVRAFRLGISLKNVGADEGIVICARLMRSICAKYHQYGFVSYSPLWNLADQFDIMWPQTVQDIYISIAVMVPISLLFVPQPLCALMISVNIASIAFGVLGFMSWWSVNLDATSMITIAMSVGFSVDFAAHVTFAYMMDKKAINGESAAYQHLCGALGSVGWPVSQASFSVLLGISTLATVDSYVVQTCFKTVFLVITFGTLHALLFLPMVLYSLHSLFIFISSKKGKARIQCNNNNNNNKPDAHLQPTVFQIRQMEQFPRLP